MFIINYLITSPYVNPPIVLKIRSIVKLCDMLANTQTKLSVIKVPKSIFFRPYASEAIPQTNELITPPKKNQFL